MPSLRAGKQATHWTETRYQYWLCLVAFVRNNIWQAHLVHPPFHALNSYSCNQFADCKIVLPKKSFHVGARILPGVLYKQTQKIQKLVTPICSDRNCIYIYIHFLDLLELFQELTNTYLLYWFPSKARATKLSAAMVKRSWHLAKGYSRTKPFLFGANLRQTCTCENHLYLGGIRRPALITSSVHRPHAMTRP